MEWCKFRLLKISLILHKKNNKKEKAEVINMAQENTHSSSEFYYVKQTIIPNLDNISDTTKKY